MILYYYKNVKFIMNFTIYCSLASHYETLIGLDKIDVNCLIEVPAKPAVCTVCCKFEAYFTEKSYFVSPSTRLFLVRFPEDAER